MGLEIFYRLLDDQWDRAPGKAWTRPLGSGLLRLEADETTMILSYRESSVGGDRYRVQTALVSVTARAPEDGFTRGNFGGTLARLAQSFPIIGTEMAIARLFFAFVPEEK